MSNIKLSSFSVEKKYFGANKGEYEVTAKFTHGKNSFRMNLSEGLGEEIVALCRKRIAEASQEALEELTILAKGDK